MKNMAADGCEAISLPLTGQNRAIILLDREAKTALVDFVGSHESYNGEIAPGGKYSRL